MSDLEERHLLTSAMESLFPSHETSILSKEAVKIGNTKWKQIRCKTFVMRYADNWVRAIYVLVGVTFIIIGVLTYLESESVITQEFPAYNALSDCSIMDGNWGKECTVEYTLDHDFKAPVYFHYKLTNFHQNHRTYVKSLSVQQIQNKGDLLDSKSYNFCTPSKVQESEVNDLLMLPCGLIANSFFNDKYKVTYIENGEQIAFCDDPVHCGGDEKDGSSWTDTAWFASPNWKKQGTAWKSDVNRFGFTEQIAGRTTNINHRQQAQGVTLPDIHDEDLMVWMRTSATSTFTKLHRIIEGQSLKKGAVLRVTIRNYFAVDDFGGSKSIVITTNSSMGGQNKAMPILFIVVGCLSITIAFLFRLIVPRKRLRFDSFNAPSDWSCYIPLGRYEQDISATRRSHRKRRRV